MSDKTLVVRTGYHTVSLIDPEGYVNPNWAFTEDLSGLMAYLQDGDQITVVVR